MDEAPKRLKPTPETFRELFLKSGNLCAFPGCDAVLMNEEGLFVGQLCHIEAAEPGGERFNVAMSNEDRRTASNLMLMYYPHHRETNNVAKYSVIALREMKAAPERRFAGSDRAMREKLARLNWAALVGAGFVASMGISGIVEQIRTILDEIVKSPKRPDAEVKPLRSEVLNILRYGPRGTVTCYSRDPFHVAVAEVFAEVFEQSGWYIHRLDGPLRFEGNKIDFDNSDLLLFTLRESPPHP